MSKRKSKAQKKKRTKVYSGEDASISNSKPQVTRIKAVKKSALREWIEAKGKIYLGIAATGVILLVLGYALFALVTWIF